ncbi:hypothetical protein ACP4OV_028122 [Aristida adscensionis]
MAPSRARRRGCSHVLRSARRGGVLHGIHATAAGVEVSSGAAVAASRGATAAAAEVSRGMAVAASQDRGEPRHGRWCRLAREMAATTPEWLPGGMHPMSSYENPYIW